MATFKDGFIARLSGNEVIVIGTNADGNHAGGLAYQAKVNGWYPQGTSEGLFNRGFGINTMDGLLKIKQGLGNLYRTARRLPAVTFYLTKIGTGIAGHQEEEIVSIVKEFQWTENVILPEEWL
jgi:O-acetyl-ADP-ribose deacetylase (regulator of RNase III)